MGAHRLAVGSALVIACIAGWAVSASAQAQPTAAPKPNRDSSIVQPLTEIGRVRARTPYCTALARARPGIDAAIAYEFAVPILGDDLAHFRLDSYLTKDQSLTKSESDVRALWQLAKAGRTEVQALRQAANADGVDPEKRKEMLAFANALDGAKARQMMLTKSIARTVATLAEAPVHLLLDGPLDDHGGSALARGGKLSESITMSQVTAVAQTLTQADALADRVRAQQIFATFADEDFIRDDLKTAAEHATNAMQLGRCDQV
ncbi:MAG: hypothetical protein JO083_04905 [Candidatus Eremiobacteraeota bacterium]|nr:hypothetical protein [Candidatus Eremiobacteraeota bacterium]